MAPATYRAFLKLHKKHRSSNGLRSFFVFVLMCTVGTALLYPKVSNADFISIFSSVFVNKNIEKAEEISIPEANVQKMTLLVAPLTSSTDKNSKNTLANAIVNDGALTNENTSIGSGSVADPYTSDRISLYTVHQNDTIEQVAKMYNVSVSTILWANNLNKGSTLKPNQVLVILPISGIKYTVKKGDTIASIAKKYKSDEDEITRFNNLSVGEKLAVGDEIIIPNGEIGEVATSNSKSSTKSKSSKGRFVAGGGTSTHLSDPSGYFSRPVVGGIRTQGLHGHNGVDLAASYGAPILAAADGQVVISRSGGWNGGYGNYVVIRHNNGVQTLYAHLSQTLVSAGETVSQGQPIGKMGSSGDSTGVHLHFEVRGGANPF